MKKAGMLGAVTKLACLAAASFPSYSHALNLWEAYQLALQNDPAYQQQVNLFQATRQSVPQARAELLPQISAAAAHSRGFREIEPAPASPAASDAEGARGTGDVSISALSLEPVPVPREEDFEGSEASITLRQTIFDRSKSLALDAAHSQSDEAKLQLDNATQSLALDVARAFFDYLGALDALDTARLEVQAVERQLHLTEERYREEIGTLTDVHESRARRELARIDVINARNNKALARHRLGKLIADPVPEVSTLPESFRPRPLSPATPSPWIERGLESSVAVRLASQRAQTAALELKRRKSGHWPTLSLVGESAYEQDGLSTVSPGEDRFTNQVSLRLRIPVFTSFAIRSRVRESQYRKFAADQGVRNSRAEVARDVRSAFDSVQASTRRVTVFKRAYDDSLEALELRQEGYLEGLSSNLDLLDAFRDAYRAKRQWLQSRYRYLMDYLTLYSLSRTIDDHVIRKINAHLDKEAE